MRQIEVPPADRHTTHCRVRWKMHGKLVDCDYPVGMDRQLCAWPGQVCPIYYGAANARQRDAVAKGIWGWRVKQ